MPYLSQLQIGKKGVTDNFIFTLKNHFKGHKNVKVVVLKSGRSDGKDGKKDVEKIAGQIISALGNKYTYRILGFTIFVKKWRKVVR